MAQVLRNFLSNALKFTPKGGSIKVIISVTNTDDIDSRDGSRSIPKSGTIEASMMDSGNHLSSTTIRDDLKSISERGIKVTDTIHSASVLYSKTSNDQMKVEGNPARKIDTNVHGRVKICVKDSGAGISSENVQNLFQEGMSIDYLLQ
jgi:signal transduction histidine kinase